MRLGARDRTRQSVVMNTLDLEIQLCGFRRILPDLVPVHRTRRRGTGSDDVQHVLGPE